MFVLFAAPPEKDVDWTDAGAEGIYRFLGRVYRFVTRNMDRASAARGGDGRGPQGAAQAAPDDAQRSPRISNAAGTSTPRSPRMMELVNELYARRGGTVSAAVLADVLEKLTLLLGAVRAVSGRGDVGRDRPHGSGVPAGVARVRRGAGEGGRRRGRAAGERQAAKAKSAPFGTRRRTWSALALADEKIQRSCGAKQVVKVIAGPDKLVNIVVKG